MYDAREKAIRDYQSAINSAHREGRQEGQQIGEQRGKLIGKIATLQELLGLTSTDNGTLDAMSIEELEDLASKLQQSVRSRSSS